MPHGRPKKSRGRRALVSSMEFIGWALGGLEREIAATRERLAKLTVQAGSLRRRLGQGPGAAAAKGSEPAAAPKRRRRRRRMSPEARKRISEMMKKRWAERKRGK